MKWRYYYSKIKGDKAAVPFYTKECRYFFEHNYAPIGRL